MSESGGVVQRGFIYESAPFPSCHAATLVQTRRGVLSAFFGGTHERHPDVCIWTSRFDGTRWSDPVNVADGVQSDGSREPTWNPVLFQPRGGPLVLFYKVGPSPSRWWGMVRTSEDDGRSWSDPRRLPDGLLGPIKNKPVQLDDGTIVSPTSVEGMAAGDDGAGGTGWRVYFELSHDEGRSWTKSDFVASPGLVDAIQPSVLVHGGGERLQAIGRTRSGRLFETWSSDRGRTWSPLALMDLPNCNSGTDAVTLHGGRHVLVYNHSNTEKVRYPLNVAISTDGKRWSALAVLDRDPPGQYSYPAVIEASDGLVHVAYTWKRQRIAYAVLDPSRAADSPVISEGIWPPGAG